MVEAARILPDETVLEVGTGRGALTPLLCAAARRVVTVEADARLAAEARARLSHLDNLELVHGDGIGRAGFDVLVSSLPYSRSRDAVEWLARTPFSRAVVMVQKEFADKLSAAGPRRRAVGVIAGHCFDARELFTVGRGSFSPRPRVDSAVLELRQRAVLDAGTISAINGIFSYRRKTLANALARLGVAGGGPGRVDELSADEVVGLAKRAAGRVPAV